MKIFFNSKVQYIFAFLTFLVLFFVLLKLNYFSVFFLDDMGVTFGNYALIFPDHGSFVAFLPNKFFGYILANYFSLHPQDFLICFGIYVKCLIFLLIPFVVSLWAFYNNKKTVLFSLFFVFTFLLVFNSLRFSLVELAMSTAFYRFTFPILIWSIFWFCFYSHYVNNKKPTMKYIIFMSLLGICLGNSSEVLAIISLISACLIFVFDFVKNSQNSFCGKLKNMEISLYVPFVFILLGFILLITNPSFLVQVQMKRERFPEITFFNTLPHFFVFLKEYYLKVMCKHALPIVVILMNMLTLFVFQKTEYKKFIYFIFSMFAGILIFFFLLFFAGETHYEGGFWLKHNDLQFVLHLCLIIIAIIPLRIIFEEIKPEKLVKKIVVAIISISFIVNLIYYNFLSEKYYNKLKIIRTNMYLYEKMTFFYWQKGERAILPYDFYFNNMLALIAFNSLCYEYSFSDDDELNIVYMKTLYPDVKYHGYYFTDAKTAFEMFYKNGGKISKKEMNLLKFEEINNNYI